MAASSKSIIQSQSRTRARPDPSRTGRIGGGSAPRPVLLAAARELMADKGARDTTIQDITERADVAFGSFYNHFTAKEAILGTVVNDALEMHARTVDELIAEIDDPLGIGDRADLDLHD